MSLAKRNSEAARLWAAKRRESQEKVMIRFRKRCAAPDSVSTGDERGSEDRNRLQIVASGQPDDVAPIVHQHRHQPHQNQQHKHSAAQSHEENAEYIEAWAGLANMHPALEKHTTTPKPTRTTIARKRGGKCCPGRDYQRDHDRLVPPRQCVPAEGQRQEAMDPSERMRRRRMEIGAGRQQPQGTEKRSAGTESTADKMNSFGRDNMISLGAEHTGKGMGLVYGGEFETAAMGWYRGPLDPEGQLLDLSDRNLLCLSVRGEEAVFGCADHALYCVDLSRGVKTRQLHGTQANRRAGHREWVSTVAHTSQGDIVSGGMDGKLCLWPGNGGDPGEVQAHAGSIAVIKADAAGRVLSCGYGGALRIWDCRRRGYGGGEGRGTEGGARSGSPRLAGELSHERLPAPCMDFAWTDANGGTVVTGHRDGRLGVYDLETGAMVICVPSAHRGHVTTVNNLGIVGNNTNMNGRLSDDGVGASLLRLGLGGQQAGGCFITGGQDGFVRVWDTRVGERQRGMDGGDAFSRFTSSNNPGDRREIAQDGGSSAAVGIRAVMEVPAHRGPRGIGAVGGVIGLGGAGGITGAVSRFASFGADKRICILELRGGRGGGARAGAVRARRGWSDLQQENGSTGSAAIEHIFEEHRDFIYCMDFVPSGRRGGLFEEQEGGGVQVNGEGVLVTGGGDGMMLVHDVGGPMRLLYGLGCCSAGAIRCVVAEGRRMMVAGDDGNVMIYHFGD